MTKTLLDGVNDVLSRNGIIDSNNTLGTLTNLGKQIYIDLAVQVWNETVDEVCDMMGLPHPGELESSTAVTLVSGTREYELPSDLVQIRWPLIDETNGNYIQEYPGGYQQMRIDQQIPGDWLGLPYAAAINPINGTLRLERTPTDAEEGLIYNMIYDKDLVMDAAGDTFPFMDSVYRAVMPVVAEMWERKKRNDFNEQEYKKQLSRAMSFVNKTVRRSNW